MRTKVFLQIHRWLDVYCPDPSEPGVTRPVGDWSIAERLGIYRGEYVRRTLAVEVPEKPLDLGEFILAVNPKRARQADRELLPFVFGDSSVLIDFDPVLRSYQRRGTEEGTPEPPRTIYDKAAIEVLIFTEDGRVVARNGANDGDDRQREDRLRRWREQIDTIRRRGRDEFDNPFAPGGR